MSRIFDVDALEILRQPEGIKEIQINQSGDCIGEENLEKDPNSVHEKLEIELVLSSNDRNKTSPSVKESKDEREIEKKESTEVVIESKSKTVETKEDLASPVHPEHTNTAASLTSSLRVTDFELLSVIGRGSYGKVFMVKKKDSGRIYAMKVLKKGDVVSRNVVDNTRTERLVLSMVKHPFIVKLRYAFQSESKLYLIMDFVGGGDLFSHLAKAVDFDEEPARFYAAEMVLALQHLHAMDYIYRDLKPENVLLHEDGHLCLTDFGFAKEVKVEGGTRSFCGTVDYMAPEIFAKTGHGKAADWWALGIVLFEMLTGKTPFHGNNRKATQQNIMSAPLKFPRHLSFNAISLIKELLRRPVTKRLGSSSRGAEDVKKHVFFKGVDWAKLEAKSLPPPIAILRNGPNDLSYFDTALTSEPAVDTPCTPASLSPAMDPFTGFSYTRRNSELAGVDSPLMCPLLALKGSPLLLPQAHAHSPLFLAQGMRSSPFGSPVPLSARFGPPAPAFRL